MLKISCLEWVPPEIQGQVRDLRVRWALEEVGLPYRERILSRADQASPEYRSIQPFGQVPAFEGEGQSFFESGAIILHIAENNVGLMPKDGGGRQQVKTWIFAALNTIEPPIMGLVFINPSKSVAEAELDKKIRGHIRNRYQQLAIYLGEKEFLVGSFSAADILMALILDIPICKAMVEEFPTLKAYRSRCLDRPAYRRALEAQLKVYREHAPQKNQS